MLLRWESRCSPGADLPGRRGSSRRRLSRMRRRTCHRLLPRDSWSPLPLLNVVYSSKSGSPVQFAVGLALILGGAHLVVDGVLDVAELLGVSALVLALIIAPLATELPEKANSFLWIREGKDSLALGNITGALVFQSAIPVALGVAFTPWELGPAPLLAATLALCGGGVAWWSLYRRARFSSPAIVGWALLFTTFVAGVWLVG